MSASNFSSLLTLTQSGIEALSLTWNVNPVQVEVASQPLNRESITPTLPTIYVTPSSPETIEQGATGGYMDVTYRIEVTIISPGNASFETNLPTYLEWRQSIRQAFQRAYFSSIAGFWGVRVNAKEVLNRDLQRDNYDFSVLEIEYMVLENAK